MISLSHKKLSVNKSCQPDYIETEMLARGFTITVKFMVELMNSGQTE